MTLSMHTSMIKSELPTFFNENLIKASLLKQAPEFALECYNILPIINKISTCSTWFHWHFCKFHNSENIAKSRLSLFDTWKAVILVALSVLVCHSWRLLPPPYWKKTAQYIVTCVSCLNNHIKIY